MACCSIRPKVGSPWYFNGRTRPRTSYSGVRAGFEYEEEDEDEDENCGALIRRRRQRQFLERFQRAEDFFQADFLPARRFVAEDGELE